MLISQMIKGCKEKFFINQIFDENIRRLHQGKKFFGKKNAEKEMKYEYYSGWNSYNQRPLYPMKYF